jgi:hypothetical protein
MLFREESDVHCKKYAGWAECTACECRRSCCTCGTGCQTVVFRFVRRTVSVYWAQNTLVGKKTFFPSLLKLRVILVDWAVLNASMTNKLPHHPLNLREERLCSKRTLLIKKKYCVGFNYNIHCQIMNSAAVWCPNYKQIRRKTPTSSAFASYIRQLMSPL